MDFEDIINSLTDSIRTYDFFVNWEKVEKNVKSVEIKLNILNYLINKNNFKEEFYNLLKEYPEVSVMPILIAIRDKEISILNDDLNLEKLDFSEKNTLTEKK